MRTSKRTIAADTFGIPLVTDGCGQKPASRSERPSETDRQGRPVASAPNRRNVKDDDNATFGFRQRRARPARVPKRHVKCEDNLGLCSPTIGKPHRFDTVQPRMPNHLHGFLRVSHYSKVPRSLCPDAIIVDPPNPLDNFPLLRSKDVEDVRDCLERVYGKRVLIPQHAVEGFNAIINSCRLRDTGLLYGTFGAAADFDFPPVDYFCQLFPLRGTGETAIGQVSTDLIRGAGAVTSAEAPHRTKISADYAHLVLRIDAAALTGKLAAMTGATISEPLRLDPQQDFKHPAAKMLHQYIPLLAETLSSATPPFPDWWIAQTEQLLMTLFLYGHQHNYSHLLEHHAPEAALRQVKLAEEYIVANAQRDITLEQLADVAGVSSLGLFAAFRRYRNYTPLEFIAMVRSRRGKMQ
jgi:AraC-binding-like domain